MSVLSHGHPVAGAPSPRLDPQTQPILRHPPHHHPPLSLRQHPLSLHPQLSLTLSSHLPHPTLFSFSSLIQAFARSSHFPHVLTAFSHLAPRGLVSDAFLLPTTIKSCAILRALNQGQQVHAFALASGFVLDSIVASSLIQMYLKCDRIVDARKLFDRMPERDVVVCSVRIIQL
ncbi:hypothetical protein LR48_Vigan01g312200 [Vigna angularis]|uniref:Pentatricopeptide repeat-containing protein n=1 Tax=Phaseolus angularis TaxID=3914 RepID=A0A0L9TSU0_PHAAN|nr:hypothetical protein LR48_Vigan01g312200 [Vigna angularis]